MGRLRYLTAGESHGPALTVIVEGMVAGLPVSAREIDRQLARRQQGYGRGGRMRIENDRVTVLAGVRGGETTGGPVCLQVANRDWPNWAPVMAPGEEAVLTEKQVTAPRPGHADLPGALKYGHQDIRNVLERASARETAARVAAGALAHRLLAELQVAVYSHVVAIGGVRNREGLPADWSAADWAAFAARVEGSPVRCAGKAAEAQMMQAIDRAKAGGDSLGGIIELITLGLPVGLGSHVHGDRRLDGRIAGSLMAIPGIKGVEIGLGFAATELPGSQVHDEIYYAASRGFYRETNRAGGIEGGMTNGEPVVVRVAMKPIPTLLKPLHTVDLTSRQPVKAAVERSDTCAVPAAAVVAEAVLALVLADAVLAVTGGDHLAQVVQRAGRLNRC
ncbi:MAG: chorismate synthase [Heliobacteriaceae bacterium]|nr:chorismate synthase [Heliobacteriaceae bacterium]MDD4587173.1 chorismate synthase [Heliobacteriaceae bacterium]